MTKTSDAATPTEHEDLWSSNGTAPETTTPESTPRRRVAYRWFVLLAVAIVLAGAGAGLAGGFLLPATHAARAEILYPITEELPTGFLREDRNLTTQLVIMRSRAVLAPAAESEGMPLTQLEDQVTISLLNSSEIIRIEVRNHSPETAMRLVDHIAETYLELAQAIPESSVLRYVESELDDVDAELAETRDHISELREQASDGDEVSDQIEAASAEFSDLRTRARALRLERDNIKVVERAAPTAELITQPYGLDSPVSPGPIVLVAAGAATGVVVAACVVAVLVRRRFRS